MKVLSVKQPWAQLIVCGAKRFEVRTWKTEYRGALYIHASAAAPTGPFYQEQLTFGLGPVFEAADCADLMAMRALPRSAIVGRVTVTDIWMPEQFEANATAHDAVVIGPPEEGHYYWKLESPVAFPPILNIGGALNLWSPKPDVAAQVTHAERKAKAGVYRVDPPFQGPADWTQFESEEDEELPEEEADNNVLLQPSPELAVIIGAAPRTREEVVVGVWNYIQAHGLQSQNNKRQINCDGALASVCGAKKVNLFDLAARLSKHLAHVD